VKSLQRFVPIQIIVNVNNRLGNFTCGHQGTRATQRATGDKVTPTIDEGATRSPCLGDIHGEDVVFTAPIALIGRDEPDCAVPMFPVVPTDEPLDPSLGGPIAAAKGSRDVHFGY